MSCTIVKQEPSSTVMLTDSAGTSHTEMQLLQEASTLNPNHTLSHLEQHTIIYTRNIIRYIYFFCTLEVYIHTHTPGGTHTGHLSVIREKM